MRPPVTQSVRVIEVAIETKLEQSKWPKHRSEWPEPSKWWSKQPEASKWQQEWLEQNRSHQGSRSGDRSDRSKMDNLAQNTVHAFYVLQRTPGLCSPRCCPRTCGSNTFQLQRSRVCKVLLFPTHEIKDFGLRMQKKLTFLNQEPRLLTRETCQSLCTSDDRNCRWDRKNGVTVESLSQPKMVRMTAGAGHFVKIEQAYYVHQWSSILLQTCGKIQVLRLYSFVTPHRGFSAIFSSFLTHPIEQSLYPSVTLILLSLRRSLKFENAHQFQSAEVTGALMRKNGKLGSSSLSKSSMDALMTL